MLDALSMQYASSCCLSLAQSPAGMYVCTSHISAIDDRVEGDFGFANTSLACASFS